MLEKAKAHQFFCMILAAKQFHFPLFYKSLKTKHEKVLIKPSNYFPSAVRFLSKRGYMGIQILLYATFCRIDAFLSSDQGRCASKLLSAYADGDIEEIKRVAQSSTISNLDHMVCPLVHLHHVNSWEMQNFMFNTMMI